MGPKTKNQSDTKSEEYDKQTYESGEEGTRSASGIKQEDHV